MPSDSLCVISQHPAERPPNAWALQSCFSCTNQSLILPRKPSTIGQLRHPIVSRPAFNLIVGILGGLFTIGILLFGLFVSIQSQLPDLEALNDIHYQAPLQVFSQDGLLIGQFGEKIRYPVALKDVPTSVINAFLAAEDGRFYKHPGFDYQGLLRASLTYVLTGQKRQGGSTITMQVARNFFLSNEKTFLRKIKEIMLAMKIEAELPKERILELYLNKIYLGNHAYGVTAAAKVYYNKTLDQLSLAESAMIAGLPKAPSAFNPIINPERALTRRDYVLNRMESEGFISKAQLSEAVAEPKTAMLHGHALDMDLPYISEIVRNEMYEQYGEEAYNNGYQVFTTIDSKLQKAADDALRLSTHEFDEKRRFRGIREHARVEANASNAVLDKQLAAFPAFGLTQPALILSLKGGGAEIYLGQGKRMNLSPQDLAWPRRWLRGERVKGEPQGANKPLEVGDILRLRTVDGRLKLTQVPEVGAALASLNPKDGAVIALSGGYDFHYNKFNRATQSRRQPGSGFKPVIYSAALNSGMTPSSVVLDAPITIGNWSPSNASRRYYGPTPLRTALTYSRNVVAVRLLQKVGISKAIQLALDMGFEADELPRYYPLALGSGSASPMRMAQMYAVFANGGYRINPYYIQRVQTDSGKTVYQATPRRACSECDGSSSSVSGTAPRVLNPEVHFMMNSMLKDVVRFGTARKALALDRPDIAGKTGTTNQSHDAWFNGYVPGLVAVTWFGYDSYKSLGHNQMGGDLALPLWIKYMKVALEKIPVEIFAPPLGPPDYRRVKIAGGKPGQEDYEYLPVSRKNGKIQTEAAKKPTPSMQEPTEAVENPEDISTEETEAAPEESDHGEGKLESLF